MGTLDGLSVKDVVKPMLDKVPARLKDPSVPIPHRGNVQLNLPALIKHHLSRSSGGRTSETDADGFPRDQERLLQQPTHEEVLQVRQQAGEPFGQPCHNSTVTG